jgi:prephenate dehydratase
MRVAYLGPPGTFSEQALREGASRFAGAGAEPLPCPTVHASVMAVADGEAERAVVPVENLLEGQVSETIDALVHDAPDVQVIGESVVPVRYVLAARPGTTLADVRVVLSHPQPLGQCAPWLREHVPLAQVRPASSTADAVRAVAGADGDRAQAALGTALAAELYGASVLAADVGGGQANVTRFLWLAPAGTPPLAADAAARGAWKSSVVFSGDGDGQPGWLVRCLAAFADRGVNLTRIESRPAKLRLGHYLFLLDLEGRADIPGPAADAIAALGDLSGEVRVLGTYPRADA